MQASCHTHVYIENGKQHVTSTAHTHIYREFRMTRMCYRIVGGVVLRENAVTHTCSNDTYVLPHCRCRVFSPNTPP